MSSLIEQAEACTNCGGAAKQRRSPKPSLTQVGKLAQQWVFDTARELVRGSSDR